MSKEEWRLTGGGNETQTIRSTSPIICEKSQNIKSFKKIIENLFVMGDYCGRFGLSTKQKQRRM